MVTRLLFALVLWLSAAPQDPPPRDPVRKPSTPSSPASISGRVTDAESGRALRDAVVQALLVDVTARGPGQRLFAATDQSGSYTITGLTAGEYLVQATPGEFRGTHRIAAVGGLSELDVLQAAPVALSPGQQRTGVDFALRRSLAIEGTVVNEHGRPLVHLEVRADRIDVPGGAPVRGAVSDDRGAFRIFGLGPGVYRLCASPPASAPLPEGDGADTRRYVQTCSPAIADPTAPGAIRVEAAEVAGAVLQVVRTSRFTLSGQIIDTRGALARNAQVTVWRMDGPDGPVRVGTETSEGSFTARALIPGEYRVRAQLAAEADAPAQAGTTAVRVDSADAAGVVVALEPGAEVQGILEVDGALDAQARARLRVRARPPLAARPPLQDIITGDVEDDLSFTLRPLFGESLIDVQNLPDGWAVTSVSLLGRDITDRVTPFSTRTEPTALRIALSNRTARLTVRAFNGSGTPVMPLLLVMPAEPERRSGGLRLVTRVTAFGVSDAGWLPPGDYIVAVWPAYAGSALGISRLNVDEVARNGVHVTLSAGENRVVDMRITAGGRE